MNPVLYLTVRAILVPFFLLYLRMQRIGREHLPRSGPLLLAANHRSFLDPFVIGTLLGRPVYYMAKRELFQHPLQAWALNALGAFPVDRGAGDREAMTTAREILLRGGCVVIFPEGTRTRRGPLGAPRRGVGRLALETGAPVAPISVIGTEHVRRGWRICPRKVRLRVGRPLRFPTIAEPSPRLAAGVTRRIWACVSLQWEWLGGERERVPVEPPLSSAQRQVSVGVQREVSGGVQREVSVGVQREVSGGVQREVSVGVQREVSGGVQREVADTARREVAGAPQSSRSPQSSARAA